MFVQDSPNVGTNFSRDVIEKLIEVGRVEEIKLKRDMAFGFTCLSAKDLIVQEYDKNRNIWATRSMIIYKLTIFRSKKIENKIEKNQGI